MPKPGMWKTGADLNENLEVCFLRFGQKLTKVQNCDTLVEIYATLLKC